MMDTCTEWREPLSRYTLDEDEVHVWRATLNVQPACNEFPGDFLSFDEWQRATRYLFEMDRRRFVLGRGVLRLILGELLGVRPEGVQLVYGPFGKPALAPGFSEKPLQFNVSHSGDLVLIAIAAGRAVGVDIERIGPENAFDSIAENFFSPAERAALRALHLSVQRDAFYACWTLR
jgi:4'-phosphopantetheinyl transferase